MSLDKYYYSNKTQRFMGEVDTKGICCLGAIVKKGGSPFWLFGYKLKDEYDYCPTMSGMKLHKAANIPLDLKEFVERGYCFGFDNYVLIQADVNVDLYFKPITNRAKKELTIEELQIILSKEL